MQIVISDDEIADADVFWNRGYNCYGLYIKELVDQAIEWGYFYFAGNDVVIDLHDIPYRGDDKSGEINHILQEKFAVYRRGKGWHHNYLYTGTKYL